MCDAPHLPTPLPRQAAWQDLELGLVYHYDLDVFMPGGHDHERSRRELLSADLYTPDQLDTDQWLDAAKAMGAKYAILTATHHQGFLQWQSDAYDFGLKQATWRGGKGDLVADFVESCRRVGVAPGIYIGIRFNAFWDVYQYEVNGGKGGDDAKHAEYLRVCERIVEEICTRYGEWCEVWFDGGVPTPGQGGPDVLPIVQERQPNAVFYHSPACAEHRWAGNEAGTAGDPCWATLPSVQIQAGAHRDPKLQQQFLQHGDPDGRLWCPAMCDAPIRDHYWLWVPETEDRLFSRDALVDMYYKSVGRNSNLIIGAIPDCRGLIPECDMERYKEFGDEIRRRFNLPVAETSGEGDMVELKLPAPARIDHVVVMEDIMQGERVREFVVEGLVAGREWRALCSGESIGHKRIEQFSPVEVAAMRLRVTRSTAAPRVRRLAAFSGV